jgi:predicted permease
MSWMMKLFHKGSLLVRRKKFVSELDEEMAFHRAQAEKDFVADGMTARQARTAAARQFGNPVHLKERSVEIIGFRFETVAQDLRFAFRQLRKNPGFAITALLVLAIGIGASVAIFAFVDAALLKPLPYREPNRIAAVTETVKMMGRANLSYPDYLDWKRSNTVFSSLDVYTGGGDLLNLSSGTVPVSSLRVSDGFFRTLGVTPMLGREFRSGEDLPGTASIVILSFEAWKKWFAGRPDIVGQKVTLSGIPHTVIGVMPEGFDFAPRGGTEFWVPFQAKGECDLRRSCHSLEGIARLKDRVSISTARAEMQSIAAQLERQYPGDNRGQGASVEPLSEIIVGDIRPILLTLLAGAGLLLIIACVNVASLLLVRSESRRQEISVRGALGASRGRLARQFVAEGLVLVLLSSALGLALAFSAMQVLAGLIPKFMMTRMPYLQSLGMNWHVLAFAVAISLVAILLFGATPLARLSLTSMHGGLAEGARGGGGRFWRRLGSNLVVVELTVAVVLLVGAGLLGKSFYRLLHVDVNFQPDHLAMLGVMVPEVNYPKDANLIPLQRQIQTRIAALPGVQSVGLTSVPPLSFNGNTDWIRFVGRPYNGVHNEVNARDISADYLKTLQAKLLRGRLFPDSTDDTRPKVALINKKLASMYFPGQDPIGQRFGNTDLKPDSIKEIIGVVDDIKEGSLDSEIWPAVYYPMYQDEDHYFTLMVRTSQSEGSILPTLVSTINAIDLGLGTSDPITMEERTRQSPTAYLHRSSAWVVGAFAVLALLLGVVGLYGVIAYSVSQRTREIGVRMALGAPRGSVYGLVLREAGWLTAAGIGLGLLCSVGAAILMRKLLFGTAAWDVSTLAAVALVLGASAMLASYLPARRAASVNPVDALRAE